MNTNNKIYLDANFLIFWALPKDEKIKKKVRIKLAEILVKHYDTSTSCLAIDETWQGIKQTYNSLNGVTKSCFDEPIYSLLNEFTNNLFKKVSIIQFSDPIMGTSNAMSHVKNFKLKPRDSFHLAMMDDNLISEIITDDGDFGHIKRIKSSF